MLEIVEQFVLVIKTAMKGIDEYRKRKVKKDFGRYLVFCHLSLLDIIHTGTEIVKHMESFPRVCSRSNTIEECKTWLYWLHSLLDKQAPQIEKLGLLLREYYYEMAIFLPGKFDDATGLLNTKEYFIHSLAWDIGSGFFLGLHEGSGASGLPAPEDNPDYKKLYSVIEEYLNNNKPQKRIRKLEKSADAIRTFIVDNFSLDEILCLAGEYPKYTVRTEYIGYGFSEQ